MPKTDKLYTRCDYTAVVKAWQDWRSLAPSKISRGHGFKGMIVSSSEVGGSMKLGMVKLAAARAGLRFIYSNCFYAQGPHWLLASTARWKWE